MEVEVGSLAVVEGGSCFLVLFVAGLAEVEAARLAGTAVCLMSWNPVVLELVLLLLLLVDDEAELADAFPVKVVWLFRGTATAAGGSNAQVWQVMSLTQTAGRDGSCCGDFTGALLFLFRFMGTGLGAATLDMAVVYV